MPQSILRVERPQAQFIIVIDGRRKKAEVPVRIGVGRIEIDQGIDGWAMDQLVQMRYRDCCKSEMNDEK